ncbi:MAG: protein kinase domain-containing protein, partial [Polyangiales bacterium]
MKTKKCPACGAEFGPEIGFCAHDGTRLVDKSENQKPIDHDPLIGRQIGGRYRLIKRIGEGGMGVVYLAEHEAIEKKVAIKILKEQYAQREDVVARFQQEAKSASRVKHQGVLEVFDFGRTEDHRFFLVMELLDGVDLAHTLEHETSIEPRRAVGICLQVARALAAAHSKGVVHRDLKPENIFARLDELGREHVKVVDFGIAQLRAEGEDATDPNAKLQGRKLTKTGMIFGTPEYMSPEQAAGKTVDQRVDVYALGVILFELLTGRTPFQGETFLAILNAHVMEPIPTVASMAPPGFACSPELEDVVRGALAKDPEGRYRTMGDLADALLHTPEGNSEGSLLSRPLSYAPPPGGSTAAFDLRAPPAAKISIAPPAGRAFDASAATMVGEGPISAPPAGPIPMTAPPNFANSNSTEATIAPAYSAPKKSGGAGMAIATIA